MTLLYVFLAILGVLLILTCVEVIVLTLNKPARELPAEETTEYYSVSDNGKSFEDLYLFLSGEKTEPSFTEDETYNLLFKQSEYMRNRFDCSDFRAQLLFKIYKDCGNKLNNKCKDLIKNTFLSFKYFMDEPGDDSMCYWSENHQILFAVIEYLAGQEWNDEVFFNNGLTGYEHMLKAKVRIDAWMRQRFNYGFSEYLSNNYLAEDIAPMANFIAYAKDAVAVTRMKIIMDILWLDVALNSVNNRFVSTSSRMYGNNKMGNIYGNSIQTAMNLLWGKELIENVLSNHRISEKEKVLIYNSFEKTPNYIMICFTDIVKKGIYKLPAAIKDIALYKECFISKMSCGLSPEDLKIEGLIGQSPEQIMAQLGSESFTNPEVIRNTVKYIKNNKMYRNSFVGYFRFLNLSILRNLNLEKVARKFNIMTHGIATGRGNVYTYRTPYYTLSTSMRKDVDMCGAQENVWCADISENIALFTTHPAGNGNGRYGASPGYWIGNGRRPMSVQHENVNITIYKIPQKVRLGETAISDITHAYFPIEFYDETEHRGNIIFGRKENVYVAMVSNGEFYFREFNENSAKGIQKYSFPEQLLLTDKFDLCRKGESYHIYITELSDSAKEDFYDFKIRILNNYINFSDNGSVEYETECGFLSAEYKGVFNIDGKSAPFEFARFDSRFCYSERKAERITTDSGLNKLTMDFENCLRITE